MPDLNASLMPGADGPHPTYCRLCEAQCGLIAQVADGRIVKVGPDRDHPVSAGHLCVKGPGMLNITYDPDRVLTPLRRTGAPGEFEPVSWDEALDDIALRLRRQIVDDAGKGIGLYMGNPASFATLHYVYAASFLRLLGGYSFFTSAHADTLTKNIACEFVYGSSFNMTFPDLERCDFILMIGANPMVSHMSLISEPRALHKLEAIAAKGGVVVVDPRRTETAKRFEHIPIQPDSDAWMLAGILRVIFEEGLCDEDYLERRVAGWQDMRDAVCAIPLDLGAERSGVAAETIRTLARRFAGAEQAACYGRLGTNRGTFSTLVNVFIEALNIVTGRFGAPGGWVFGTSVYADSGPVEATPYGEQRSRIGGFPVIAGLSPGGAVADEITTPGEGQLRVLFTDAGNPVLAYPGSDRTAAALDELELMVSLDFYITETTRHAHYILPTTTFFERADLTDLWVTHAPRPWVQFSDPVISPVGEARHEFAIYEDILKRLDLPGLFSPAANNDERPDYIAVADQALREGPYGDGFGERPDGLSVARLRDEHASGVRVRETVDAAASWRKVAFADGKPRLWNAVIAGELARLEAVAPPSNPDVLKLFGRRKLRSLNSWMHNSAALVRADRPTLQIHPADAAARHIADGDTVRVTSKSGVVTVVVELTDDIIPGAVNYPHGWGHKGGWDYANGLPGANINLLASADPNDWEQVSGMCWLDGIPVTVVPTPAI